MIPLRRPVFVGLAILAAGCAASPGPGASPVSPPQDSARVASEVTSLLGASAEAWNRGDLEGFLDSYTDDPSLEFVGTSGVVRGKDAVRETYRSSYFSGSGEPDDLRFDQLVVRPLGERWALAHGRWTLYQPGFETQPVTAQGRFSLVLRWEDGRWRIVHDHSS